jgi:ribosomal protein S18 acetylase RimI-like enzyme
MRIRSATVQDIPALVSLNQIVHSMHVAAYPGRFRQEPPDELVAHAFKEAIEASSSYWLLAEEEQVCGFLSAEFRQRDESWHSIAHHVCYIGGIVVSPHSRRLGIARTLLDELKREACVRSVDRIELDVWAFNSEARMAFASLGFHSIMERMTLAESEPNKTVVDNRLPAPSRNDPLDYNP